MADLNAGIRQRQQEKLQRKKGKREVEIIILCCHYYREIMVMANRSYTDVRGKKKQSYTSYNKLQFLKVLPTIFDRTGRITYLWRQ